MHTHLVYNITEGIFVSLAHAVLTTTHMRENLPIYKKSFKITKGKSETVNKVQTIQWSVKNGQNDNLIREAQHRKLKTEQHEPN
jgi:hypothetical protein